MQVIYCKHKQINFYNGEHMETGCEICERKPIIRKLLRSEYDRRVNIETAAESQALKHVRDVIASGDKKAIKWMLAQLAAMSEVVKEEELA